MLKGVLCFTDAEAPSMRMFDFFPFTKRVFVNMGGDPPTFVKARLPFGTSQVCRVLHSASTGMDDPQDCRSGNPFFVVADIRYMMHTREQLSKRLEVAEAMRAFISHHLGDIEETRSQLESVEANLATA
ncbi:hypothetical protein CK203_110186 [Vitis vinifera]|uniref:Uncharacterized protein n=1 Tax=Vitis vinifera TaxID=29760 RepID=A0A438FHG7_VITVI|nr:hypothetical protein CK203_110186 [Vitis vinifera]